MVPLLAEQRVPYFKRENGAFFHGIQKSNTIFFSSMKSVS